MSASNGTHTMPTKSGRHRQPGSALEMMRALLAMNEWPETFTNAEVIITAWRQGWKLTVRQCASAMHEMFCEGLVERVGKLGNRPVWRLAKGGDE